MSIMARKKNIDNSTGPSSFVRDENGLLKNIQYIFQEDGSNNWRQMINESCCCFMQYYIYTQLRNQL
jgi:hypothetical protein